MLAGVFVFKTIAKKNNILAWLQHSCTISMNWNTNVISSNVTGQMSPVLSVLPTNVRALTLAFATGECGSENWAGVDGGALAAANVPLFTAANVNYVISTGGAAGSFTSVGPGNCVVANGT
ncbi:hypothetical protein [Burkholderia ubonensis]|uniref:hypothetical protein n=1 Tax=Burkholderia ubonensis TaxID=101571 RepID=UPI001E4708BB|nr:hypothetical protein [Burkholderia ubonensis]